MCYRCLFFLLSPFACISIHLVNSDQIKISKMMRSVITVLQLPRVGGCARLLSPSLPLSPYLHRRHASSSSSSTAVERYTSTHGHTLASLSRIDLALVIDCTSSMQPYIHSAAQVATNVLVCVFTHTIHPPRVIHPIHIWWCLYRQDWVRNQVLIYALVS